MKTAVFNYDNDKKPSPESLKQGFIVQWEGDKRQLWLWGFDKDKLDPKALKVIVTTVLEDILKS